MTAITLPKAIDNFVAATNAHDVSALQKAFGGQHGKIGRSPSSVGFALLQRMK